MPKPKLQNFGVAFPENTPLLHRHQYCAYHNRGLGSFFHRKEIMRAYWPEETYTWHDWAERRLKSTCEYGLVSWIGAGATGKSTDAAAQAIQWWMEAPSDSAVVICSTTVKMLRLRIWSEVTRLFSALPNIIEFQNASGQLIERHNMGDTKQKLIDSDLTVRWERGDNKHAIFGMAVGDGPVHEAVANLVGIHATRVWLILDELQGVREAIMSATDNMAKNPVFRLLGMGNTDEDMKSPLRRISEPVSGWDSIDVTSEDRWEIDGGIISDKGIAERFDGRKSPAVSDPKKFHFLITQKQIDAHIRKVHGNMSDPSLCSQCFAIWPPLGLTSTVLDEAIIAKFRCCHEPAVWTNGFQKGASLDPAFEGADRKILQFLKFGLVSDDEGERWVVEFGEWMNVPIDTFSDDPIHYQIVEFCKNACESVGISSDEFSLDSTGEGGGLKAIFDIEWGVVMGIEFGGRPSETPVDDKRTARDIFDRRTSELNYALRNFALGNGIRGLSKEAAQQACARKTVYKNKKNTVEKKSDMKLRTGESPDNCDACCVGLAYVQSQGARSGGGELLISSKSKNIMRELAREGAAMIAEENLLRPTFI